MLGYYINKWLLGWTLANIVNAGEFCIHGAFSIVFSHMWVLLYLIPVFCLSRIEDKTINRFSAASFFLSLVFLLYFFNIFDFFLINALLFVWRVLVKYKIGLKKKAVFLAVGTFLPALSPYLGIAFILLCSVLYLFEIKETFGFVTDTLHGLSARMRVRFQGKGGVTEFMLSSGVSGILLYLSLFAIDGGNDGEGSIWILKGLSRLAVCGFVSYRLYRAYLIETQSYVGAVKDGGGMMTAVAA